MKFLKAQTTNNRGIDRGVGIFYNTDQTVDIRSKSAMKVPVGSDADRPAYPALGQMRFNTTNNSVEFYDNGVWKEIRLKEPTPITQQSLGTGDGTETVFGPLNANDSSYPVPQTAQSALVIVENVLQLSVTNYTLEQSVSGSLTGPGAPYADGWFIKFTSAPDLAKPITVLHNFDK